MKKIILMSFILVFQHSWAEKGNAYVEELDRDIKALSNADIENFLQGAGMGFAMAAELNQYPGPKHVLDLAMPLTLTTTQVNQTRELFERMRSEAILLGRQLVEEEKILDRLFKNNEVNEKILRKQLQIIAALKSQLRFIHLSTHLQQKVILTPHQIEQYDVLRGYASGHKHEHSKHSL